MFRLYFKAVNLLRALITGLKYVVVVKFTNLTKVQNWALPLLSLCRWKSQKMQKKKKNKDRKRKQLCIFISKILHNEWHVYRFRVLQWQLQRSIPHQLTQCSYGSGHSEQHSVELVFPQPVVPE